MTGSRLAIALIIGLSLLFGGAALAQEDLSAGKTPEQLFRLNCAACHKSPVGLARAGDKAGGLFGLENFLAQHYTATGRSAQLIANYLKSVDSAAEQRRSRQPRRQATKPKKPAVDKTDTAKSADKPDEMKAGEAKANAPKAEDKVAGEKSGEPNSDKPKMTEPKPDKPAMGATEAKPDKPKTTTGDNAADKKSN
jgi:hypothetical protein